MRDREQLATRGSRHRKTCLRGQWGRVLNVVLIVMIVISSIIVIGSFGTIVKSNQKIRLVITEASDYLRKERITPEIERVGKTFIERLEAVGKYSMEASTISFLVTLLSAGVIAFGVYLVDRGHRHLRALEDRISSLSQTAEDIQELAKSVTQETKSITKSAVAIWRISAYMASAYQMSWRLQQSRSARTIDSLIPPGRDLLNYAYVDLKRVKDRNTKVDSAQRERLLEQVFEILDTLERIRPSFQDKAKDLVDRCNNIIELLRQFDVDK